jgi:hypothetical protein
MRWYLTIFKKQPESNVAVYPKDPGYGSGMTFFWIPEPKYDKNLIVNSEIKQDKGKIWDEKFPDLDLW